MTVNPFWFGVLMCIVAEIMLVIVISLIGRLFGGDDSEDETDAKAEELFDTVMTEALKTYVETNKRKEGNGNNADSENG